MVSAATTDSAAKTHICPGCEFPISVYGRLQPCQHAFCLRCSSTLLKCAICQQEVAQVQRVGSSQGVFISPVTLQSFTTPEAIEDHTAYIRGRLKAG